MWAGEWESGRLVWRERRWKSGVLTVGAAGVGSFGPHGRGAKGIWEQGGAVKCGRGGCDERKEMGGRKDVYHHHHKCHWFWKSEVPKIDSPGFGAGFQCNSGRRWAGCVAGCGWGSGQAAVDMPIYRLPRFRTATSQLHLHGLLCEADD